MKAILKYLPKKLLLLFLGDAFLASLSIFLTLHVVGHGFQEIPMWTGVLSSFVYLFTFYIADLYDLGTSFRGHKYLFKFTAAVAAATILTVSGFFLLPVLNAGRTVFFINAALIGASTYSWRLFFEWCFRRILRKQKRLLIVGAGWAGKTIYKTIEDNPDYKVVGFIDDDPCKWGSQLP